MIESIHFENFKALRNATLPLGRFTLIVGPNGSGKSTALQALQAAQRPTRFEFDAVASKAALGSSQPSVGIGLIWTGPLSGMKTELTWKYPNARTLRTAGISRALSGDQQLKLKTDFVPEYLNRMRFYSLNSEFAAQPVKLAPNIELARDGSLLAGVLDQLRDRAPERWEALNEEFGRWLPEFDQILFDTVPDSSRVLYLRLRDGHDRIPASDASQGTLLALCMLTLVHLPDPPSFIGLEEPDRGLHPRLLRDVRDALYRLAYPEEFGESRPPVQVVATTHSPFFLDMFRDRPEEIVIAEKSPDGARFERLADKPDIQEILSDTHLGEAWYTGVLGGVPATP